MSVRIKISIVISFCLAILLIYTYSNPEVIWNKSVDIDRKKNHLTYKNRNIDSIASIWKNDSTGCSGCRNLESARILLDAFNYNKPSSVEVLKLLGNPNSSNDNIQDSQLIKRYKYYYNTACYNGSLLEEADKCWVSISFDSTGKFQYCRIRCN